VLWGERLDAMFCPFYPHNLSYSYHQLPKFLLLYILIVQLHVLFCILANIWVPFITCAPSLVWNKFFTHILGYTFYFTLLFVHLTRQMQIGECVCSGVYTCLGSNSNIGMINFAFFNFRIIQLYMYIVY